MCNMYVYIVEFDVSSFINMHNMFITYNSILIYSDVKIADFRKTLMLWQNK